MKPTEKAPQIDQMLVDVFGVDRQKSIRSNTCVWCNGPADEFRNDLSRKEYSISGMCQKCQDGIFGID